MAENEDSSLAIIVVDQATWRGTALRRGTHPNEIGTETPLGSRDMKNTEVAIVTMINETRSEERTDINLMIVTVNKDNLPREGGNRVSEDARARDSPGQSPLPTQEG